MGAEHELLWLPQAWHYLRLSGTSGASVFAGTTFTSTKPQIWHCFGASVVTSRFVSPAPFADVAQDRHDRPSALCERILDTRRYLVVALPLDEPITQELFQGRRQHRIRDVCHLVPELAVPQRLLLREHAEDAALPFAAEYFESILERGADIRLELPCMWHVASRRCRCCQSCIKLSTSQVALGKMSGPEHSISSDARQHSRSGLKQAESPADAACRALFSQCIPSGGKVFSPQSCGISALHGRTCRTP